MECRLSKDFREKFKEIFKQDISYFELELYEFINDVQEGAEAGEKGTITKMDINKWVNAKFGLPQKLLIDEVIKQLECHNISIIKEYSTPKIMIQVGSKQLTADQLTQTAKELHIKGRSTMSRKELATKIAEIMSW
jgi:hypothetical protein